MKKTKIVCTIGPKTESEEMLAKMLDAGMNVMRLNFSHGDYAAHRKMYDDVREAARQLARPVAVLADLCGPKIRTGLMQDGAVRLLTRRGGGI